jgi:hypothetical protein
MAFGFIHERTLNKPESDEHNMANLNPDLNIELIHTQLSKSVRHDSFECLRIFTLSKAYQHQLIRIRGLFSFILHIRHSEIDRTIWNNEMLLSLWRFMGGNRFDLFDVPWTVKNSEAVWSPILPLRLPPPCRFAIKENSRSDGRIDKKALKFKISS